MCYAGFNISLLAVPGIRRQFTERYHAPPSSVVHASDLIFTVLGVASLVLQLVQAYCLGYARDPLEQRVSTATRGFIFACGVYVVGTLWLTQLSVQLQMLDVVYSLSTVKLAATFPKMLSQVLYNYRRRSTRGWSLHNILLDVSGGVLSMIQLLVDAYIAGNLGLAFRNPVKLYVSLSPPVTNPVSGLGLLSILFDAVRGHSKALLTWL